MPTKTKAAATNAREDILSPHAMSTISAGAVSAMSAVGAAVIKMNKGALNNKPDWFWHLFAKCEAKAARIAEQAARAPNACGDATFIEVYARNLPKLMTSALTAHAKAQL
jgi:hypothetical protein